MAGGSGANGKSRIRSLLSPLLDRLSWANQLGLTFGGKRDIYSALGYDPYLEINKYKRRYERGGIAERIVEAYPLATWAGGARIVEDPDPNRETDFEQAVRILFDKRDVWARLTRADILASLGRFSVLLLGATGSLASKLPDRLTDLLYVNPIAEDKIRVKKYVEETSDPRYGLPEIYTLSLGVNIGPTGSASSTREVDVHWSRVIHVAEGLLENEIYGKPRLRSVWNYLDDLDKLVGGGAEAAWKRMDPGMQVDVDPEMELSEAEEELLSQEIDEYQHDLRRAIRTRGTKINLLASQVQGFGPNADTVLKLIAATTGIPHRILTGSERGELASTQDRSNWADRIAERRRGFATPLVRQLIGRLIERGVLPQPAGGVGAPSPDTAPVTTQTDTIPGGYDILWPEVGEINNAAKAEVVNKLASANQQMFTAGLAPVITSDEIRHVVLGLGPLELRDRDLSPIEKSASGGDPTADNNPGDQPQTDDRKKGVAQPARDSSAPSGGGGGSVKKDPGKGSDE